MSTAINTTVNLAIHLHDDERHECTAMFRATPMGVYVEAPNGIVLDPVAADTVERWLRDERERCERGEAGAGAMAR